MLPFAAASHLTDTEVGIATRAMLRVAHTEGGIETAGLPLFDDILADCAGGSGHIDAARFIENGNRELLMTLCILTAYADGHCSAQEQAVLQGLAADMGLEPARLEALQAVVKDQLLASLSHLPDVASVAAVARELG